MYIQKDRLLFLLCFFMIIILISCVKEKKQDIIEPEIQNIIMELPTIQNYNMPSIFDVRSDKEIEKNNNREIINLLIKGEIPDKTKYTDEILNLNGTWQPDWSYEAELNMTEEENNESDRKFSSDKSFSWGIARSILHTTIDIDITAEIPFFNSGGDGTFYITDISKINSNIIKVNVIQAIKRNGILYEADWEGEFIFRFIDKNTMSIENEKAYTYKEGNIWYRRSGPDKQDN